MFSIRIQSCTFFIRIKSQQFELTSLSNKTFKYKTYLSLIKYCNYNGIFSQIRTWRSKGGFKFLVESANQAKW